MTEQENRRGFYPELFQTTNHRITSFAVTTFAVIGLLLLSLPTQNTSFKTLIDLAISQKSAAFISLLVAFSLFSLIASLLRRIERTPSSNEMFYIIFPLLLTIGTKNNLEGFLTSGIAIIIGWSLMDMIRHEWNNRKTTRTT